MYNGGLRMRLECRGRFGLSQVSNRMSNTVTLTPGRLEFTPRPAKQSERDTTQLQGPDMEIDNHHSKTNDEADAQKTD